MDYCDQESALQANVNLLRPHVDLIVALTHQGDPAEQVIEDREVNVHVAYCVVCCIDPTVFTTENLHVDLETKGDHTYGMTVIDKHRGLVRTRMQMLR